MPISSRVPRPARRALMGVILSGLAVILPRPVLAVNATTGPAGHGPEHWVSGTAVLNYRVDFENLAGVGAAPAQVARVSVPIDASLDVASFRLGNAGFGGIAGHSIAVPANRTVFDNGGIFYSDLGLYVQYTAGIDPVSRLATFTFTTLDVNRQPPTDPLVGFLPPNDTSGRGQGFITFSIRARADAEEGAVVSTTASIRFDQNVPLVTGPAQNTLDTHAPTSQVVPPVLPQGGDDYALALSSDDGLGSGVGTIDLFVSADGAPYALAASGPAAVLDTLSLPSGHVYAVYSRATDHVGLLEPAKLQPDVIVDLTSGTLGVDPGGHAALPALAITAVVGSRVKFALAATARVTATVFDLQGRPVRALASGATFAAGEHTLVIPWGDTGPGVCFVEVRAAEHRAMRRVVRLR
ncbi:MAG: hypothetical protein ABL977_04530 [Candidatus Eisenbacteria bacterium]